VRPTFDDDQVELESSSYPQRASSHNRLLVLETRAAVHPCHLDVIWIRRHRCDGALEYTRHSEVVLAVEEMAIGSAGGGLGAGMCLLLIA
jgi:hypothetical protein